MQICCLRVFSPYKERSVNNRRKRDLNPRLVDYDPTILTTELLRPKTDNHCKPSYKRENVGLQGKELLIETKISLFKL